jgi:hypothetical protein
VEHLLEAVVADEITGTVLALAISRFIIAAQGASSKLFDKKEK